MILEVYDALKAAGAPEEKAQLAATVLANTDNRFDKVDAEIGVIKTDIASIKSDIARVKSDLGGLKSEIPMVKTELAVLKAELAVVKWLISGIGFGVLLLA